MTGLRAVMMAISMVLMLGSQANSQAFCALRNPTRSIHAAFPQADAHQSIVRSITEDIRNRVAEDLPFTLHFNELGRHTLYVATQKNRPLGLLHVRSEQGSWSMVEIAWSLDCRLRILGFQFQRCRSAQRGLIETKEFRDQIIGKTFSELQKLLTEDGKALAANGIRVPSKATPLALSVLRSALKTISVTQHAWAKDIQLIQDLEGAVTMFPEGARISTIRNLITQEVTDAVNQHLNVTAGDVFDTKSMLLTQVFDKNNKFLGCALRTLWRSMDHSIVLWWKVTPELVISEVVPEESWPNPEVEKIFQSVRGLQLQDPMDCLNAVQLAGLEILITVRTHLAQQAAPRPK